MRPPGIWLVVAAAALELCYWRLARLGDLRQQASTFLVIAGLAFAIYLGAVAIVRRWTASEPQASGWVLLGVLLAAAAFRLTLAGLTPTLSDDIYRYLWDGRVQLAGINPYRYAPDHEALRGLRDASWTLINHKSIPTIYPPVMELAFRLGAWISPTIAAQKAVFLACDIALAAALVLLLPRFGVHPLMSLVYAWHPVVVIEVAGSGHNDPLGALLMMLGVGWWHQRRRAWATVSFALSLLAKFTTVLLWPFYALRERRLFMAFLAIIAVGALWSCCSPHFTPGMGHYARHWEFNSSLYHVAVSLLGNPLLVRLLLAVGIVALGCWVAWRTDDLVTYLLVMIQATILAAPVLEPWYLMWLIPLLCVRWSWMWLIFSGLTLLSYTVLVSYAQQGVWRIPLWAQVAEYAPLYGWLAWRMVRWRRPA